MKLDTLYKKSIALHRKLKGKLEVASKVTIKNTHDLSLAYTPGVAGVAKAIAEDQSRAYELTIKHNAVAVVSDGSAVLGLGNIGPYGAIPVMEGKALLFKAYADIDAFPICVSTQDVQEIIQLVKHITPVFAGINLEDIAAPRCFVIEDALQDIGIPVFHDDQHGAAIALLAALINAARVAQKNLRDLSVVVSGAGAAGTAIAKLLRCVGHDERVCEPVKDVIVCDSKGIISLDRKDIADNSHKKQLATAIRSGSLEDAMEGADVFIGVSRGNTVTAEMIRRMNTKPIVFAMANPVPEILPEEAMAAGAFIVGTGRSDFPNQVNNVLVFPGIFRGAIDAHAPRITNSMKIGAAAALAGCVEKPTRDHILPSPLDTSVPKKIAARVKEIAKNT